jgi:hypothetical protein
MGATIDPVGRRLVVPFVGERVTGSVRESLQKWEHQLLSSFKKIFLANF